MTNLEYLAQALNITLGFVLIAKLLSLRLHVVYRLFSLFLFVELVGSVLWLAQRLIPKSYPALFSLDYRLLYVAQRLIVCSIIIPTVYALLGAVLKTLPGILNLSRKVLNGAFSIAAIAGVLSWAWEYSLSGYSTHPSWQDHVLFGGIMTERVVSSVVLVVIASVLTFLLWFPVRIPRNLAIFIIGFAVYSSGFTVSLLVQSLVVHDTSRLISTANEFLFSACFAYWAFLISSSGEKTSGQLAPRRNPEEEARLIQSLELLNESLMRSAGR